MLEQNIRQIQTLIQRLAKSNLLVIDKEISLFLSELATTETFKNIVTECNHNYSFDNDWQKLLSKKEIILPHNKKQRVAFIIGLLYKLDIKNLSSIDMLKTFYGQYADLQIAYNQFCQDIIYPLQEAFIAILKGEPVEIDEEEQSVIPILDKMNEDIQNWLLLLIRHIGQNNNALNDQEEKELYFLIKGFASKLETEDTNLIKLLWIGLKNTLYKYDIGLKEVIEIEKLFSIYGLDMEV